MAVGNITPLASVIAQSATTSGVWAITGATVGNAYRLNVTSGATAGAAGNATTAATSSFTLPAVNAANKLPAAGTTGTVVYRLQEQAPAGTGTWVDTAFTNITVRRLANPCTTSATQNFDTTTLSNTIPTHAIVYTAGAAPSGTINFAVSTTASTYASVASWSATNSFSLIRGTTYYFWTRSDTDASCASVQQLTVPYATGTPDTAITLTTVSPVTSYINGVMPATETTTSFTIASGTSTTQYGLFKNFVLHTSRDGNGAITATGGGLPDWGNSATYWISARISPNFGGDPAAGWSAVCTGTINGSGTSIQWTMARKVYDPTFNSVTLKAEYTQLATAIVNATASNGTLFYSKDAATWSNTTNEVGGYTRSATANSATVYIYSKGVAAGTDSNVVSQTWSPFFNDPDLALTSLTVTPNGQTATNGNTSVLNSTTATVSWTGGTTNTVYRVVRTLPTLVGAVTGADNLASGIIGDGTPATDPGLPTVDGDTWTFAVQGRVETTLGGNGTNYNCTVPAGYQNPFTIYRIDTTPSGYTALAGAVVNAPVSTYYYATFSGTAAGTTTPGTAYTVAGVDSGQSISVSVSGGEWRKNAGTFGAAGGSVVLGDLVYFRALSASTTATQTAPSLTIGGVQNSFTINTIDGATPSFPYLAGDVTSAAINTYYYATFSTTAAGTTSPGTGYTLNDITVNITVTATNGEFRTTSNATWRTSDASVAPGQVVYFRALTGSAGAVQTTHSLKMGNATTKSFVTTTISDTTPDGYTALGGNVTGAAISGYYYATFSTATPGLTEPGTGYTLNDVNVPVLITVTNGEFRTTANATWRSAQETVAVGQVVYFRGLTSATAGTLTQHSLTIGATNRSFTTTTAQATTLDIGTLTVSASELTGGSTANVSVSWTPVSQHTYRIVRTDKDPDVTVAGNFIFSPQNLNYADANDLPTEGVIATYKLQVIRTTVNNGDNVWYTATTGGLPAEWSITRIKEPIVSSTQLFDTATNSSIITHTISLESNGVGGTASYAKNTTNAYPATWQASAQFVNGFTRGSTYYLFARRSTDLADYSVAGPFVIPAYAPSTYGLVVYSTNGSKLILSPETLPTNLITCRVGGITNFVYLAAGASATVTAPGVTTTNGADVFISVFYDGGVNLYDKFTITRGNGSFIITNNDTVARNHYFLVGRYR